MAVTPLLSVLGCSLFSVFLCGGDVEIRRSHPHLARHAVYDSADARGEAIVPFLGVAHDLANGRHVGWYGAASQCIDHEFFHEGGYEYLRLFHQHIAQLHRTSDEGAVHIAATGVDARAVDAAFEFTPRTNCIEVLHCVAD